MKPGDYIYYDNQYYRILEIDDVSLELVMIQTERLDKNFNVEGYTSLSADCNIVPALEQLDMEIQKHEQEIQHLKRLKSKIKYEN